jgi:hypothetical protein
MGLSVPTYSLSECSLANREVTKAELEHLTCLGLR